MFWKGKMPEGKEEKKGREGGRVAWRGENDSGKIENTHPHPHNAVWRSGMRKRGFQGYSSNSIR